MVVTIFQQQINSKSSLMECFPNVERSKHLLSYRGGYAMISQHLNQVLCSRWVLENRRSWSLMVNGNPEASRSTTSKVYKQSKYDLKDTRAPCMLIHTGNANKEWPCQLSSFHLQACRCSLFKGPNIYDDMGGICDLSQMLLLVKKLHCISHDELPQPPHDAPRKLHKAYRTLAYVKHGSCKISPTWFTCK